MDQMEQVREGMTVVDREGEKVGKVEYVRMGDPGVVTTQGSESEEPGLIGTVRQAFVPEESEPDVPEPLRSQLLREGFLKVDGPGLLETDRYVGGELVGGVSGDTVRLRVSRDQLPRER